MQQFHILHLLILISLATRFTDAQNHMKNGCNFMCGDVWIESPFGIGRNCSLNEWFNIDCNSSTPYLSAFNNVEVLEILRSPKLVIVKISMVSDCDTPIQKSSIVLNRSPFVFSSSYNTFVVQGCGSAAIMEENGTIVAGCSTTCGNDTISDINNCFGIGCCQSTLPHDLQSFTFNLTGLEKLDRYGTCGSASLVFSNIYNNKIYSSQSIGDHNFVPISLSWNESFGCNNTCGGVSIPYPFGIGINCSLNEWFNVDCNSSIPYLSALDNVEVLNVSSVRASVTVNVPMISDCMNPLQNSSLDLSGRPYRFSRFDNIFVVKGCGNAAIMERNGTIITGCSTTCGNGTIHDTNKCFGIGCCETTIPYSFSSFTYNLTGLQNPIGDETCVSAFLVDKNAFIQGNISRQFVPTTLQWTRFFGYESFMCRSCHLQGGFCYPNSYEISGMSCHFQEGSKKSLRIILGVSISMGSLLLTVISYALYKIIKKTRAKRRKQRYFKRNGGILLKKQEATETGLVDKTILFTSNELEKATDHFNENRILGRGGQGTVYKGMLPDGRIVAIKKSKVVDESQLEQFINEVVILSQVNHRNVVKLLGCCLETDVPLLVSEFISNGTLYDLIHDETGECPISLNMRLQIATEVAGALSYLHSATSIPIYHRDIKTTNILLDEKYRAKVSDFGTSRFVSIDQTHLTTLVKGTFGYLDPEYFQSSQFTEKSDVYSFGVVLLELLTREKPISLTRFGENRSLATHFLLAMEEGRVMSIFDAMVVKEGSRTELLAVANLAMRCLNFNGKNRPTMKEVSIELEGIRLSHVPSTVQIGHVNRYDELSLAYGESTLTSMTFDYNTSR